MKTTRNPAPSEIETTDWAPRQRQEARLVALEALIAREAEADMAVPSRSSARRCSAP